MASHVVGTIAELEEHGRLIVEVEGRSIGIVRANGELFALRNSCAHQLGPLCEGGVFPAHKAPADATGVVREFLDHEHPVICCPWHGWEFDVRTGVCLADTSRRVATYPVSVDGDEIVVVLRD